MPKKLDQAAGELDLRRQYEDVVSRTKALTTHACCDNNRGTTDKKLIVVWLWDRNGKLLTGNGKGPLVVHVGRLNRGARKHCIDISDRGWIAKSHQWAWQWWNGSQWKGSQSTKWTAPQGKYYPKPGIVWLPRTLIDDAGVFDGSDLVISSEAEELD